MMDYTQGHRAAQMMEKMGGGFASAIAHAYYKADSSNAMRLRLAFYEMFEQYLDQWTKVHGSKSAHDVWLDEVVK